MADLRIEDATLTEAQAALRMASDRLAPVVRELRGLDAEVVGADPLAGKLLDAQELLGAGFGIIGQAVAEVAGHAAEISAVFTQADGRCSPWLNGST